MWSKWVWSVHSAQVGSHCQESHGKLGNHLYSFNHPLCPTLGASQHTCSSKVETNLPIALLLVPAAFQPVKVAHVPWVGPQDWGPQYVAWTAHSSERVSVHVMPLLFCVPHLGTDPNLITSLLFLSDYMWIFLAALVVPGSFCQFPVHFEWEVFHMKYIFDVFMGGVEFHLLHCQLDLLFNKQYSMGKCRDLLVLWHPRQIL